MKQEKAQALLGLLAQTSIHAGTGQNTGVIDLPIQREGHNGWPCVFGSAMKGALRAHAEQEYGKDKDSIRFVFGPSPKDESVGDHAGAIMVSDARLVLLPIRSLTSQFKWVTCPDALKRLQRDAQRFAITNMADFDADALVPKGDDGKASDEHAYVATQSADLFLEEYRLTPVSINLDSVIEALASLMDRTDAAEALKKQLVIVSDDMFTHLVQHTTPVNAHIAIDSETKIVSKGSLWYEETLPPETLLYVGLSATPARKSRSGDYEPKQPMPADAILGVVTGLFKDQAWLQIGGNETVGMGWCAVNTLQGGE